jgi:aryl-alcohol dehydrogenase-like predicted oxidoreductase
MPETRHAFGNRRLGKSGLEVLPLGIGTNKWGNGDPDALMETYRYVAAAGPSLIDTAEVYGSEKAIGRCHRAASERALLASKFAPFPFRASPRSLVKALDGTLSRLGVETIDLYFLHFALPLVDLKVFADGLAEAVKSGKARSVGVSNMGADKMRRMADLLDRSGIPLAANEVRYSLTARKPETNGVLDACREIDVALVAFMPLSSGSLSAGKEPKEQTELHDLLSDIAEAHDASISQVSLNWLLCRDECIVPIPGATKPQHAADNLKALDWRLSEDEFDALERASVRTL